MEEDIWTLPTSYLGPISYYRVLLNQQVEIEAWEHFPKRTLRNRCQIAGANGVQTLTIPVSKCNSKQLTKDVKIVYQQAWQQQHWNAIKSAYEHTPYYIYYEDYLRPYYEKKWEYLLDYNMAIQEEVLHLITMSGLSTVYVPYINRNWQGKAHEDIWDEKQENEYKQYYQIFADRNGFQKNLSIVDLLFNMGPEGILMIK